MSTETELYDEDESNEYRLLLCDKCLEPFPAIVFDEHQELCKRFMEFVSLDEELDFEVFAEAAAARNADDRPANDGSSDEVLCDICQRYFPNSTIDDHRVLCQVLLEQYAGFEAIKSLNTSPPDNNSRSEPVQPVIPESIALEPCEFCDENIPVNEFDEHKYMCGSRKEKCDYCNNSYEIRNRESHLLNCGDNYDNVPQSTPEEQKASLPKEEPKLKAPAASSSSRKGRGRGRPRKNTSEAKPYPNFAKGEDTPDVKAEVKYHAMSNPVLETKGKIMDEMPNSEYLSHHEQEKQGQNMAFGKDETKDSLNEGQSFKIPNNPLLRCIDQTETEDICYLSDDDCDESLEEFWTRALNFLKRRSMLNV